jgi:hypothetical protein
MIVCFRQLAQTVRLSPNLGGSTTFLLQAENAECLERLFWEKRRSGALPWRIPVSHDVHLFIGHGGARWAQLNFIFRMGLL